MSEKHKVLVVDDSPNILNAFKRQFRKQYQIYTAENGKEALSILNKEKDLSVIVSDMQMPGMNGAELLAKFKKHSPDTIRILLTGQANLDSAISAINEGQIYRFLTKPCSMKQLSETLEASINYFNLLKSEKELLERTLKGSVSLLIELMNLLSPTSFSHSQHIKQIIKHLANRLELSNSWEFEIAAMLSGIGAITLPQNLLEKHVENQPLSPQESRLIIQAPHRGAELLQHIPRLENVAQMIKHQRFIFRLKERPQDLKGRQRWLLGGHMIRVALEFDKLLVRGWSVDEAIASLQSRSEGYSQEIVQHLIDSPVYTERTRMELPLQSLRIGMVLDQDIFDKEDQLILAKGYQLTQTTILRLQTYAGNKHKIREPVHVLV